jgi:hypothetical protein
VQYDWMHVKLLHIGPIICYNVDICEDILGTNIIES